MAGSELLRGTTILALQHNGQVAVAGDGQITVGDVVMKHKAKKVRTIYRGQVLAGFAGAVADALTLFDKFEGQLDKHQGNLRRASVELAKEWRTDRYLRRLDASLIVADAQSILVLSGQGEVIEPDDGIVAIGSGGAYAHAAARALTQHSSLSAAEIARKSLEIAASLCIYTNSNILVLELGKPGEPSDQL